MPLTHKQFLIRLANITDPELLCDVLDITSEDIIERFEDLIEDRLEILKEVYDINLDEEFEEDD